MAETSINSNGSGTYDRILGRFHLLVGGRTQDPIYTATQERSGAATVTATDTNADTNPVTNLSPKFDGNDYEIELPFGTFYVGHFGTCTTDNNNYLCFNVAFDVNATQLNILDRETVTLKLTAMYRLADANIGNSGQVEDTLVVKLNGTGAKVSMTLTHGRNSLIVFGDSSSYPNSRGTIELFNPRNKTVVVNRIDRDTADNAVTKSMKDRTDSTVGYQADVFDSDYGKWYVATDNSKFEFRPDATLINAKSAGDSFSTRLVIAVKDGVTQLASDGISIEIEYRGTPSMTLTRESGANYTTYTPTGGGDGVTTSFSGALFEDLVGNVEITNAPHPSSINYTATVKETFHDSNFQSGNSLATDNFDIDGVTYRRIGDNLRYGTWYYVTNGTGKFLFRPNPAGYRTIPKAMEGTSVLTLNLREGGMERATKTFTIRFTRPADIFLVWDDSSHGGMISSAGGTTTYDDLIGTIDNTHTPTTPSYDISVNEGETGQSSTTAGVKGTDTSINSLEVETYGTNLTYGTWYVATDRTKVIFRPNSTAINTLKLGGMSITTTLTLILNETSPTTTKLDEFTVTVVITGQPSVQLTWDSGRTEDIIQSKSGATSYGDITGRIHFTNTVEHFHLNNSEAEEILNPIRYPDFIDIDADQTLRQIPEPNPGREITRYSGTNLANPNPGFSARTIQSPEDNTYGTWYIADDFSRFLFRPKAAGINGLNYNQQAHAKLIIVLTQTDASGGNEMERARGSIIVALKGRETSVTLTWDSQSFPRIVSKGETTATYEDFVGTIEVTNPVPLDSNNDLPIGGLKSSENIESWEIGPVDSNGDTRREDTSGHFETIMEPFNADLLGLNFETEYGRWFIADDFSKFGFRPDATGINNLESTQSLVVTLFIPIFDPYVKDPRTSSFRLVNLTKISITITGPNPTVDISLNSRQESASIEGDGYSTYRDIAGAIFTTAEPANSSIKVIVTEQKDDEQLNTAEVVSNNTNAGFQATPYQRNLSYGVLYYATAGDRFLYRPNSSAINALAPESSVNVIFRLELNVSGGTANPVAFDQIVITISRTLNLIELTWDNSANNGEITGGESSGPFNDLEGLVQISNLQSFHSLKFAVVEKFDIRINETAVSERNREVGYSARKFTQNLEYGNWYFATNNQLFLFRPNAENIVDIPSGRTITSTLSVIVVNDQTQAESAPVSIAVTITTPSKNRGNGPFISVTASADSITAGESIRFLVASTSDVTSDTAINLHFNQDGGSAIWKLPKSFPITSGESEFSFNVLTHNFGFGTNDSVTITATVMDGTGYEVNADYAPVEVIVMKRAVTATSDTRISVATNAVSAILQVINDNSASSEEVIPFTISIYSDQTEIQEGEVATFQLRSTPVPQSNLTVYVAVEEIDQVSSIANRSVSFSSGQEIATLEFQSTNDEVAEVEDGTIRAILRSGTNYQIDQSNSEVSIVVSDSEDRERERQQGIVALNESVIPELIESAGERTLDILSSRIFSAVNGNQQATFKLGGNTSIQDMLTAGGELVNDYSIFRSEILGGTSFSMPLFPDEGIVSPLEVWGLGDHRNISGNSNKLQQFWKGDVFAGNFGVDYRFNEQVLTGLSISVADSQIEFTNGDGDEISHVSLSQNLHPYFGWNSTDQTTQLHTMFGVGQGDIKVTQEGHETEVLESNLYSVTFGGKKQLLLANDSFLPGSTKVDVSGDAWFVNMIVSGNGEYIADSEFSGNHVQLATNGSHQFVFSNGSSLVPSILVGFRNFKKFKQREYGLELNNSLTYNHEIGLNISGTNKLFESANNDSQQWEFSGTIEYDRFNDDLGEYINLNPTWSNTAW